VSVAGPQIHTFIAPRPSAYSGRIKASYENFRTNRELERRYFAGDLQWYPIALTRGKGVFLYDLEDKPLSRLCGKGLEWNALGHAHPRIVKTIREQAAKLIHVSNLYYHEYQGELAEQLLHALRIKIVRSFSNSGTEAIEGSIKLARLAGHHAGARRSVGWCVGTFVSRANVLERLSLTGQEKHRKDLSHCSIEVPLSDQNDADGLRAAVNDNTCAICWCRFLVKAESTSARGIFCRSARRLADQHRAATLF